MRSIKHFIIRLIQEGNRHIMATLEEIQAAQAVTDSKIAAISADITALIAKVGAVPLLGLTPEQQAAIDDIAVHANKINDALAGVDAAANPPA
jgi:hypothetical protein